VAEIKVPLPVGEEVGPVALLTADRVFDTRSLERPVELHAYALEADVGQRRIERQRGEIALAGADVARCIEAMSFIVEDQDAILGSLTRS
jgi:hypothetical protein